MQYCSSSSVACMRRKQEQVSGSRNESVKLLCELKLFLTVLTTENTESQVNLCVARTLMINNIHHIIYLTFNFEWYSVLIDINEQVHYLKKMKIQICADVCIYYITLHNFSTACCWEIHSCQSCTQV